MQRLLIFLCLTVWPLGLATRLPAVDASRPNLILILADDHGIGDVSAYYDSGVQTPHIDRLGAEGLRFTAMRANCTVCSPSRAALLTGRYPDRVGVPGVIRTAPENSWGYLDPQVPTLADELRQAGYHTALVGKWHLGLATPNTPIQRGFDHFHGFLGDMMDSYTTHLRHGMNYMRLGREVITPQGHATELFTDWAIEYVRQRVDAKDGPFLLYLAYNAPHFPIQPPQSWLERVRNRSPELTEERARNIALIEHLDSCVGRLLDALVATNLERQTLVVYTSDNGGSLPHAQCNEPWRGGKQDHYDGGLRVPFVLRWPDRVLPGVESDYQGLIFDLFPTCLELAGRSLPPDLDAVSLAPILRGDILDSNRDLYFVRREGGLKYGGKSYEAIIRGPWKLLQNDPYSPLELYHLDNDPRELHDLAALEPGIVQELSAALAYNIQRGGTARWQSRK